MKHWLGRLVVLGLVFLAAHVSVKDKGFFRIQTIEFAIESDEKDLPAWSSLNKEVEAVLDSLKGRSLIVVSLKDIKMKLDRFRSIQNLQVIKSWPRTLRIQYSLPPLKAVASLQRNRFHALSSQGQWIGPLSWSQLPKRPWLRGSWMEKKPDLLPQALGLIDILPKAGGITLDKISEIGFNEGDGFAVTLVKTGQQIIFGYDDFEVKALRANQVLNYLQNRNLESCVIDANFSKKVLVRLRNQP